MEILGNNLVAKSGNKYYCEKCDYVCYKKYNWAKHVLTSKHNMEICGYSTEMDKWQKEVHKCTICEKQFKTNAGLWKHKKNVV
jgi:hypothetical protein